MSTLEDVLQLWLSKPEFRDQFKKNPKAALEMEDLQLSNSDLDKILAYVKKEEDDGSGTNEELGKRINK